MDKLSCEMCMDLMPLVRDGVASGDSRQAVEAHMQCCETCSRAYEENVLPGENRDEALFKAVKRVKRISAAVLVVMVLMGILLCELVFQGSSVVVLAVVLGIRELLQVASEEGRGWKQTLKRSLAAVLALAAAIGLLTLVNVIVGNPYAKKLASVAAEAYLDGKFPEQELYIADIRHDSKQAEYEFEIRSEISQDTYFTVCVRPDGSVRYDTYDDVLRGYNTAERVGGAYRQLAAPVVQKLNLTYTRAYVSAELGFEHRQWQDDPYESEFLLDGEPLVVDGEYDILALGKTYGRLDVTVEEDTVSGEKAAEVLLEIKRLMDEAGVPFRSVDLTLRYPRTEDPLEPRREGSVEVADFLYEDIYEEDLVQRVEMVNLADEGA